MIYNRYCMSELVHLEVRNPKDDETPIEAATQIFASLLPSHLPLWKRLFIRPKIYAFELYLFKQTADPLPHVLKNSHLAVGEVGPTSFILPTKTYFDFKDIDPLSSVLGFLSK